MAFRTHTISGTPTPEYESYYHRHPWYPRAIGRIRRLSRSHESTIHPMAYLTPSLESGRPPSVGRFCWTLRNRTRRSRSVESANGSTRTRSEIRLFPIHSAIRERTKAVSAVRSPVQRRYGEMRSHDDVASLGTGSSVEKARPPRIELAETVRACASLRSTLSSSEEGDRSISGLLQISLRGSPPSPNA